MFYEVTEAQMRELLATERGRSPNIWEAAVKVAAGLGADKRGQDLVKNIARDAYYKAQGSGQAHDTDFPHGQAGQPYSKAEVKAVIAVLMALQTDLVAEGVLQRQPEAGQEEGAPESETEYDGCPCCYEGPTSEAEPGPAPGQPGADSGPSSPVVTSSGLKDTGARTVTETGGMREPSGLRGRFDLLPPEALRRYAIHMQRGAQKYADRNWEKGIETARTLESAMRHLNDFMMGDITEDHLAAAFWNLGALMTLQERIERGALPSSLETLPAQLAFDRPKPWAVDKK